MHHSTSLIKGRVGQPFLKQLHLPPTDPFRVKLLHCFLWIGLALSTSHCTAQTPTTSTSEASKTINRSTSETPNPATTASNPAPKGIITYTQGDRYPSLTYYFHDDSGKVVKTIREDQFPSKNPVFKLDLPKNPDDNRLYYFQPFIKSWPEEQTARVSESAKTKALNGLSRYGLQVKRPETAARIVGSPGSDAPFPTEPHNKYMVRCEKVSIYDNFFKDSSDVNGNTLSNSLLDCSYLVVYNHLGNIVQEIQISGKIVQDTWISDDGKYIFCGYGRGYLWDEGASLVPGGFMMIDVEQKINTEIDIPGYSGKFDSFEGFFADRHFQLICNYDKFLYVNPYEHSYYLINCSNDQIKDKKMSTCCKSFMPYEGLSIDLSKASRTSY